MKKNKGFTLIELLVVVAILGILATIVSISVAGAALKSRDSRRKADLDVIKKAVSLYAIDNGYYPVSDTNQNKDAFCTTAGGSAVVNKTNWESIESKTTKYLDQGRLPLDPKHSCPNTSGIAEGYATYSYITDAINGSSVAKKFSIWTYLEYRKDTDNNSSGIVGSLSSSTEKSPANAKGKFKNTFYYTNQAGLIDGVGDDTVKINSLYAVGTPAQ